MAASYKENLLERKIKMLEEIFGGLKVTAVTKKPFLLKRIEETKKLLEDLRGRRQLRNREVTRVELGKMGGDEKNGADGGMTVEGKNYFKSLPEEILVEIFKKLEDPKDFVSCSKTCEAFSEALKSTKGVWIFHEILPFITEHLKVIDVVKCRKVCRQWKRDVDEIVEKARFGKLEPGLEVSVAKAQWLLNAGFDKKKIVFNTPQSMDKFCDRLGVKIDARTTWNPFYNTRVIFDPEEFEEDLEGLYWARVLEFLDQFGEHIRVCSILTISMEGITEYMETVQQLLERLPNVGKLTLDGCGLFTKDVPSRRLFDLMKIKLQTHPFPELPKLVSLKVNGAPKFFSKYVVPKHYGRQLHTLKIMNVDFDEAVTFQTPAGEDFQDLAYLSLDVTFSKWRDLSNLKTLSCPLRCICIRVFNDQVKLGGIINALQHFSQTLEFLRIKYNWEGCPYVTSKTPHISSAALSWSLPHVRILEVREYYESFNYILCLPSLQYLALYWGKYDMVTGLGYFERSSEVIQIYGFLDRMYDSNIWTLIPSLKQVRVLACRSTAVDHFEPTYDYCYTREVYESKQELK